MFIILRVPYTFIGSFQLFLLKDMLDIFCVCFCLDSIIKHPVFQFSLSSTANYRFCPTGTQFSRAKAHFYVSEFAALQTLCARANAHTHTHTSKATHNMHFVAPEGRDFHMVLHSALRVQWHQITRKVPLPCTVCILAYIKGGQLMIFFCYTL